MKKLIAFLLIICTLSLTSCNMDYDEFEMMLEEWIKALDLTPIPDKPEDTNLEFWIGDRYSEFDLSGHYQIYGMFGGKEYLGLGYEPISHENCWIEYPEHYVLYTFTGYPDHSDSMAVSSIMITDPAVNVWGLTVESSPEEFKQIFDELGFKLKQQSDCSSAQCGRFSIVLYHSSKEIIIRFYVTNIYNIIF